ncbi:MAG: dephospho-CoA kinase [Treponema sp.]|nr:dephospho-CoA kinase [Treponema sp.]
MNTKSVNEEKKSSPHIICLTGKMAAGKNYLSSILEKSGFVSLDADLLVHKAVDSLSQEIFQAFKEEAEIAGIQLLNKENKIDRRALGSLIFPRPQLLKRQEDLVYPRIIQMTKDFIRENEGKNIILNATVLYKTPELLKMCSKIVFVTAPLIVRLFRAKKRDKIPLKKLLDRFKSQKKLLKEYQKFDIPLIKINNRGNEKKLIKNLKKAGF